MKAKKVIVTIEVETEATLKELKIFVKNIMYQSFPKTIKVIQVQANKIYH